MGGKNDWGSVWMPATAWPSPMKTPWRFVPTRLPKFCRLTSHKEKNHEIDQELENGWRLGAARLDCRHDDPGWFGEGPWILSAGGGGETGPEPANPGDRCRRTGQRHFAAHSAHLVVGTAAHERILGRRHLSAHLQGRTIRAPVRLAVVHLGWRL